VGNGSGGVSDTDNVTSPVAVAGGQSFTQLDAGASHNCAIANKFTYCWGFNGIGQLGVSSNETCAGGKACSRTPARLAANLKFSAISLGSSHSCGLIGATGQTYCWGYNRTGQLGDGTTSSRTQPALVNGPAMKSLHLGGSFSCGIGVDNLAYCWGLNYYGALGVGDTTDRVLPTQIPNLTF
jgi:alpha-tubulin suppressor-like RCC1 family protein